MKVVITQAAWDDLLDIGRHIASDSPRNAEAFLEKAYTACLGLGEMPEAFERVPRHEGSGIRRRPFGNYLIFYRADEADVEVLRVIHGAREYERILFPGRE